jgi:predicted regulator of Ras-like GTPase activity (Roadblock/LC7/MglB family)
MEKAIGFASAPGFEGEVTGLGLPDIIQLNAQNRFSGCIDVQHEQNRGLVFFRDGEIIHAEHGSTTGEEAFYAIVAWPGGRFTVQPNVATTRSTIRKGAQHLLLEAHRVLDEERAGRRGPPEPAMHSPAPARPPTAAAIVERLRQIPGVVYAVVRGKDGARVGDDSYEAEVVAGQALYLALTGNRLGASFQVGELVSAAVQGTSRHLLFFATRNHFLSIVVSAEAQLGPVEAAARKIFAGGR